MKLKIIDGVQIVIKHSMTTSAKSRRERVIVTLENTLKSGLKNDKKDPAIVHPLTEWDKARIKNEIAILKTRV